MRSVFLSSRSYKYNAASACQHAGMFKRKRCKVFLTFNSMAGGWDPLESTFVLDDFGQLSAFRRRDVPVSKVPDTLKLWTTLEQFDHRFGSECQRGSGGLLGHGGVGHDEPTEASHRAGWERKGLGEGVVVERFVPSHLDALQMGGMAGMRKMSIWKENGRLFFLLPSNLP